MKRFNLLATIALLFFAFSAQMASAVTFKDLNNYQKQKYWEFMKTDCRPFLIANKPKEFKACEAKALHKAFAAKEPVAAWCNDSDQGMNFLTKGIVTSNLFPNGKPDYSHYYPQNGKTYVMEGICTKAKKYQAIQKDCAELGNYKAKDGVCVIANHAPQFEVDTLPDSTISEGESLTMQIGATDEDGDTLEFSAENLPDGSTFQKDVFEWTPTHQQAGEYEVTFSVNDGKLKDTIKGKIVVTDLNQTPEMIIVMNSTEVNEGEEHKIYLHAADKDGDPLEFSAENLPEGSTFDNDVPSSFPLEFGSKHAVFTWTPGYQQAGEYEITFKVSDGNGGEDSMIAPVTVKNVNAAPVLDPIGNKTVKEGEELKFEVTGSDPYGDKLEFSAEGLPEGASFIDGIFIWKIGNDQAGKYEVVFSISDGELAVKEKIFVEVKKAMEWKTISNIGAPSARVQNTAVWTGSEMIIWGGTDNNGQHPIEGGRYNPDTDTWTPMSTISGPKGRPSHTAIWTGEDMIVWGGASGSDPETGYKYNPKNDTWKIISNINAPASRTLHTALWTGKFMIVWGGSKDNEGLSDGGIYDPVMDTWSKISMQGSPLPRRSHKVTWTGEEMIVWGGQGYEDGVFKFTNTGGVYSPKTNTWKSITLNNAPSPAVQFPIAWTGTEVLISSWSGNFAGGRYNPQTDSWTKMSAVNSPINDMAASALSGDKFVVWGGFGSFYSTDVFVYSLSENKWNKFSLPNTPAGRTYFDYVWTGKELIVWGGNGPENIYLGDGGKLQF